MAAPALPKYSLQLTFPPIPISAARDLIISNQSSTLPVSPAICDFLQNLAKDYVFAVGTQFKGPVHANLTLSAEKGVVFNSTTDEKMKKVFAENKSFCAIIPEEDVIAAGLQTLPRRVPLEEVRLQGEKHYPNTPLAFFDPVAIHLLRNGVVEPVQIELEIESRRLTDQPGGLTTAPLRFPHLLKDLSIRFATKRESEETSICILGPGLLEQKDTLSSCPQFIEIYSLFPKATYLLLDHDARALGVMKGQFHKCKFGSYDPLALCSHAHKTKSESYRKTFEAMRSSLAEMAIKPKNAKEMLEGKAGISQVVVKVDPSKIQLREFEINTSQFEEKDRAKFDVVVATMSLLLALGQAPPKNSLAVFEHIRKFLDPLKEGGALYVDSPFVNHLIKPYGEHGLELGLKYLESCLGNRLMIEELPLSDFQPGSIGKTGVIDSQTIYELKNQGPNTVSTASLTVITRLPEKVMSTPEERRALEKQIAELG